VGPSAGLVVIANGRHVCKGLTVIFILFVVGFHPTPRQCMDQ